FVASLMRSNIIYKMTKAKAPQTRIRNHKIHYRRARKTQAYREYLTRTGMAAVCICAYRGACSHRRAGETPRTEMSNMNSITETARRAHRKTPLNRSQIAGFWGAWAGWTLDGMDSFIYALVLTPALTELLPRSGYEANAANIGLAGSILFALFLVGWGL